MPHLENELTKLANATCFAKFDLSRGYWQFELEAPSQETQSFIIPDGAFSLRVLHGTINAVTYLQSTLARFLPRKLNKSILFWLDDVLIYSSSVDGLL